MKIQMLFVLLLLCILVGCEKKTRCEPIREKPCVLKFSDGSTLTLPSNKKAKENKNIKIQILQENYEVFDYLPSTSENILYIAEVKNNGKVPIHYPVIKIEAIGKNGEVLGENFANIEPSIVKPGEVSLLSSPLLADVESKRDFKIKLSIHTKEHNHLEKFKNQFPIQISSIQKETNHTYVVSGKITNNLKSNVSEFRIPIGLYNENQRLVGVGYTSVTPFPSIFPNQTSTFKTPPIPIFPNTKDGAVSAKAYPYVYAPF